MKAEPPQWKRGDEAWLQTNDAFGSKMHVRILSLHKAGTVHLKELNGGKNFVNHVNNLKPFDPPAPRPANR